MKNKSLAAALMAAILWTGGLSGCAARSQQTTDSGEAPPPPPQSAAQTPISLEALRVPHTAVDPINPYTTHSVYNFYLSQLLYDPLVRLDASYKPQNCLAVTIVLEETTCTVTLREDARFSDGSPLTSADVGYSLSLAMQSGYFGAGLTNILQVEETAARVLTLTLAHPDEFFVGSLCFPIVKNGTGGDLQPVGTGRYLLSGSVMTPNPAHFEAGGAVKSITLVEQGNSDALNYALKNGDIDYLFSDLREKWHTNLTSSYQMVQLNNLVFLGVNANSWPMNNPELVQILYSLFPREQAVSQVYGGNAIAAWLPFNPSFYGVTPYRPASTPSMELVSDQLDSLGYGQRDGAGYRTSSQGIRLSLTLLCSSENGYRADLAKLLSPLCAQAGIELLVESVPYADYLARLQGGAYDLYIGEAKIPYNMDITPLLPGGYLGYGSVAGGGLNEAYAAFRTGEGTYEDFTAAFLDRIPFIPILYRRGLVSFSFNFGANIVATEQDIFYNILDW